MPAETRFPTASDVDGSRNIADGRHGSSLATDGPSEQDPLLASGTVGEGGYAGQQDQDLGSETERDTQEKHRSFGFLLLLTLVIGGLQTAWTVEFGSITPFLQELGLSKALLSLVWIAGPLSGALAQPWVGIQSDRCRSRLGRRRPFMIAGALVTTVTILALAWSREIVGGFLALFGVARGSRAVHVTTQIWAVVMVYILDFAINIIQAGIRAFIVDSVPPSQQETANAVAGVVNAFGSIAGFLAGETKLTGTFSWLANSQFKILCILACVAMLTTLAVSCIAVKEKNPRSLGPPAKGDLGLIGFFRKLYRSVRALPKQVKTVCMVEVFAWAGYFPFLFYTTTHIGNLYAQPFLEEPGKKTEAETNRIFEEGTRQGTHAMFIFSVTSLVFSIVLPIVVTPSCGKGSKRTKAGGDDAKKPGSLMGRISWDSLRIPGLTLRRAWMLGHLIYALLMWLTLLARTPKAATALIAVVGLPWAVTQWAPFAFIAAEISERNAERKPLRTQSPPSDGGGDDGGGDDNDDVEGHVRTDEDHSETQAGIVLGIHNVAVAAPQVVATLVSSVIFKIMQKPRGMPGDDSTGWVLRAAGLSALVAAWFTRRIVEDRGRGSRQ